MGTKISTKTLTLLLILFLFLLQTPKLSLSESLRSNPLSSRSPASSSQSKTQAHIRRILLGVLFGSLTGIFASIVFLLVVRLAILFANRTPILKGPVSFSGRIDPKTLQLAFMNEPPESNQLLISSSPHGGSYFQLPLDNELTVVVKRIELSTPNTSPGQSHSSMKRRMQRELELLAKVKHRNVMSLRAYVRGQDSLFLVYDCIAGGSLEEAMKRVRSGQLSLGWEARHRIAVGIVKGLRCLHFECSQRILHYGLKPENVMLDEGFEPRLGDCGLARLVPAPAPARVDDCYVAPECYQSCR